MSDREYDREAAPAEPVELDAFDMQGISDIVNEVQEKITLSSPEPKNDKERPVRGKSGSKKDKPVSDPESPTAPLPRARATQPLPPPPPPVRGVTESGAEFVEVSLGTPQHFDQMFKPSDTYAGQHSMDDEEPDAPPPTPKVPFWQKLRRAPTEEQGLTLEQALTRAVAMADSYRLRFYLSLAFFLPLAALTLLQGNSLLPAALRYTGNTYAVILIMVLLQGFVMALGLDILTKGVSDLLALRPGTDTLLTFSCLATLLHAFTIVAPFEIFAGSVGFMPYCAVSAAGVCFSLLSQSERQRAYVKSYRTVLAGGETPDAVVCEDNVLDQKPGFSRRPQSAAGFHHIASRPDIITRVMGFLAPLLMIFCVLLALLASSAHTETATLASGEQVDGKYFAWALAALANAALPLTTFCAFTGIFSRISSRLAHLGAAVAGWPAALEMSKGFSAILTDGDLFPPGSIVQNGKRINNNASSQILSYAASMLEASGSGLFRVFREIMADGGGRLCPVTGLTLGDGGISGLVEENTVLLGTLNYMFREGMEMPKESRLKHGVFIAINRQLAGIFVINYLPHNQVKSALTLMDNQKLSISLATRDFNITPNQLKEIYGQNPDPIDYPDPEQRTALSDPNRPRQGLIAAVLTRDGLNPYIEAIVGGQRLHRITIINLVLHFLCLLSTLFIVYYFARSGATEAAMGIVPGNLLLFGFVWWVILRAVSWFGSRY